MIHSLRKKHRAIFSVLSAALPLAFVAAIAFRAERRPAENARSLPQNPSAALQQCIFEKEDLWADQKIVTRIYAHAAQPAELAVELHPAVALAHPEILVYWNEKDDANLKDAFLLGTLAGTQPRRWLLPQNALQHDGYLVLFSLAHQSFIAQAHLPTPQILQKGGRP